MRNLPVLLLEPQDLASADTQSAYIDLAGLHVPVGIAVIIGALTGVDGSNYLVPTLQEATETPASASSYSAVDANDIDGAFTKVDDAAEDSVIQFVEYHGRSRYVNVLLNYTGTGITAGIVGVVALVREAREMPPATPTTGAVT